MAEGGVRAALRTALVAAMKGRDRVAVSVYRTTLAAIDNAEAVPLAPAQRAGAIEASPARADVARTLLTEDQVRAVVFAEAAERRTAAEVVPADVADRLRREAALLDALLAEGKAEGWAEG